MEVEGGQNGGKGCGADSVVWCSPFCAAACLCKSAMKHQRMCSFFLLLLLLLLLFSVLFSLQFYCALGGIC